MQRPPGHVSSPEDSIELVIALIMGPLDDCSYSEAQLRSAWEVRREEWLRHPRRPGTRPWAYWHLELGEEPPEDDDEPIRLAELGLLHDEEIAAIAERANEARTRIGTTAEHYGPDYRPDRRAVELDEAVKRALREPDTGDERDGELANIPWNSIAGDSLSFYRWRQ